MYIAVVQNNPTTGALAANAQAMLAVVDQLADAAYPPDLVVFPAYAMSGYPLDGLAYSTAFGAACLDSIQSFIQSAKLPCLFGSVTPQSIGWRHFSEAEAIYCQNGRGGALGFTAPSGMAFEQPHYIQVKMDNLKVAIFMDSYPDYSNDYLENDLLIILLAKEYEGAESLTSSSERLNELRLTARDAQAWVVLANLVGGQDDVVFDGGSLVISPDGSVQQAAPLFDTGIIFCNLTSANPAVLPASESDPHAAVLAAQSKDRVTLKSPVANEADWQALVLSTRDYVLKNGFSEVALGISGGIDSALTATLAVDALGAENVHGLLMPSLYTDPVSVRDAQALAKNLGIATLEMPITEPVQAVEAVVQATIGEPGSDTARQNLQARMRMVYLMHLSNSFDWLVLNTTNKSEAAMGYSTLYGDTAGAFSPFGNTYKTEVYELARWRNQRQAVIPLSILEKAPSGELYAGQLDTDRLPPYEVLDRILRLHIEDRMGIDEIIDIVQNTPAGDPIAASLVSQVLAQVSRSEFKRRQEPLAPSIGSVDMNRQRAWPVTNGFIDQYRDIQGSLETLDLMNMLQDWERPEGWGFLAN